MNSGCTPRRFSAQRVANVEPATETCEHAIAAMTRHRGAACDNQGGAEKEGRHMTTDRLLEIATRFEREAEAFINLIEQCGAETWQAECPGEDWPIGGVAEHVAGGMRFHVGHIVRMANGRPLLPVTMDQIHASNLSHASSNPDIDETLGALRANAGRLAGIIRDLTPAQLENTAPIPFLADDVLSTQELIERIVIPHVTQHADSIRRAIEG
jgi:hypothetical protein